MTLLTYSFEGGSNGATLLAGDTPGPGDTAFDVVVTGASTTNAYDSTQAAHGTLGYANASGASAASAWVQWTATLTGTSISQVWFRTYLYYTANPTVQHRVVVALNGATVCANVRITTGGKIQVVDGAGTPNILTTSTASIPLNQWFRIEGFIGTSAGGTTGQTEVKLFTTSMDSTTADETDTSAASGTTSTAITKIGFGHSSSIANVVLHWLDDLGASDTGYIGPAVTAAAATAAAQAQPGATWLRRFHHRQIPQAAAGAVTIIATANLAAAGAVTAVAVQDAGTATALAGAGTVTAAVTQIAQAALAGAGSVTDVATQIAGAAAAGAATVTDVVTQAVIATPAGAATVTDVVTQIATATIAGAGAVTATGISGGNATATIAGAGSVTAVATQVAPAATAGAGAVSASGQIAGTAGLAAAGSVTTKAAQAAGATLTAAGAVTAVVTQRVPAALGAAGAVTAAGNIQLAFTVGALTASDVPFGVLTATATAGGSGGVLTASDTRTGGPG